VWRLLRGDELPEAQTRQIVLGGAAVLLALAFGLPGLFALVQLGVFGALLVLWLLGLGRGQPGGGVAGWWYRPVTFPWLQLLVFGVLSVPFAVASLFFGRIYSLPGAAFSVLGVGLVARWIAYRRRSRARRRVVDQPDTPERRAALVLLRDNPAAFMRAQAAAAGHGVYLGTAGDRWVFSEAEHAVLVLGPPRSGKTSGIVVPTILSANGALLCTSTKTDVLADTIATRAELGTCWLFDPTAAVVVPDGAERLAWSPLWGCEDWERARERAHAMVGAAAPARGVENETHWTERAEAILGPLLHAAAVGGEEMATLVAWVNGRELQEARDILAGGGSPRAGESLGGMAETHYRELSGIWSTTAGVVAAYQSERALATTTVAKGEKRFDADAFVRSADTIYVAAGSDQQRLVAPLVVGLIDDVRRATYRATAAKELAVPVLLALDEVRNIAPIRDLPSIVSEAGGQGLVVLACFQDLSQAEERWGAAAKGFLSLFNTNVILRGIKERATLELVSVLFGEHEVEVRSRHEPDVTLMHYVGAVAHSLPTGATDISTRKERQVPLDAVARGYPGQAIVLNGAEAPEWLHLTPAFASSPWTEIIAGTAGPEVPPSWRIHAG